MNHPAQPTTESSDADLAFEIFCELIELDAPQRAARLGSLHDEAPGSVVEEVRSLLAAHDASTDAFLESGPVSRFVQLNADAAGDADDPLVGSTIGAYRIERLISTGGMGRVYLAHRADGAFEQRVALKVIKRGMDTDDILRRFREERQMLANLNHPNIAQLLDGGSTEDGRPYLVMEYVDGAPITTFCDERRMSVDARLELFCRVCEAVDHAHRNLIVHRDLKPGNILVRAEAGRATGEADREADRKARSREDREALPKIIDFGIAKVLDPGRDAHEVTVTGERRLTPAYASPEQIRGESITTATDVYSLGVILYELLVGERPYAFASTSMREMETAICDMPPRRPATLLAPRRRDTETIEAVCRHRDTDRAALRRRLRGDLETIVLAALAKEPQRRYASAARLADDIRALRSGRPISARPVTTAYTARKFIERNRLLVAAGVITLMAMIGAIVGTSLALVRAIESGDIAARQARIASEVNAFLNDDLLRAADPRRSADRAMTVREALDAASERIEGRFADEPLVEAAIRMTLGQTYLSLGAYPEATPHLQRAYDIRLAELGPADPETLDSYQAVAVAIADMGDRRKADAIFRETLEARRRTVGPEHPDTLETAGHVVRNAIRLGLVDEAEELAEQNLRLSREALGEDAEETLHALNQLAILRQRQGRLEESQKLYEEVVERRRATLGEEHPDTLMSMNELAGIHQRLGDFDEAVDLFNRVIELRTRVLGGSHIDTLVSMNNLGLTYSLMTRYDAAREAFEATLAIQERDLGPEHPHTLTTLDNLGTVYNFQKRHAEAQTMLRRVLEIRRRTLGDEHLDTLISVNNLALAVKSAGEQQEAEALFAEAARIARSALEPGHWHLGVYLTNHGDCLLESGRTDEAEPILLEALEIIEAALGPDHHRTQSAARRLVRLYEERDNPQKRDFYQERYLSAAKQ